ncbi:MAG: hypothetical protein OMM_04794 [Candidatus Magnetoglobus multicellularis str. Araruama]|uniref:Cadherin domain-containing protein n=1 Tax=Candidatus Magnetoglobus multicellularis str. Araruama TaxID=890399 RepID=A0A1V1NZX5_9BACT|nr:MAG: hypothetical protein OMM_04794 [Candidatus Magnetoglobus multicellularis str. Araruama]
MKLSNKSMIIGKIWIIYLSILSGLSFYQLPSAIAASGDIVVQYSVYENKPIGTVCVIAEGNPMVFTPNNDITSSDGNWIIMNAFGAYQNIQTNTAFDYETYAPQTKGAKIYTIDVAGVAYPITLTILNTLEVTNQRMGIAENASNNDVVGIVNISDYDLADFRPTFTIRGGNTNNVFALSNPSGGTIVVNDATKLDYESIGDYNLVVQVANGTYTETATIAISVSNVSDSPVIENQLFSIDENSNVGSTVGTVIVTRSYNYNLTYDITAGNTGNAFTIGPSNGIIKVNNKSFLDYETTQAYTLTVQIGGGEYSPSAQMLININDVNEAPVLNNQSASIDENSAMGTIAYTVIATDQENDALSYVITDGNTGNAFSISETTGVIYVSGYLNFESLSVYNLIVAVRDSEYTKTVTISIDIIDVNEPPSLNNQTMSVNENMPNNTPIGSPLSASDPDADDPILTFSIIGGSGIDAIKISSNGQMSVKDSSLLNYESGITSYTVIVQVSDPHALTDTAVVTIHCNNVNEAPMIQPQSFVIAEHTANATVVYTMISSDPDTTNSSYTNNIYRITGGSGSSIFTISTDGEISVSNSSLLDYETAQTLLLTVKVEDKYDSSLYASETVSISLINMNDNHPIVTTQTYSVGKYCTNGVKAAPNDISLATDADGDLLTYEIIDGNINNAFSISNDGFILINNADQIKNSSTVSYFIGIAVNDGTYTATGMIRVNLENYPPSISAINDVFTKMDTPKVIVIKVNDSSGDSVTMTVFSNSEEIIPNDDEHITIADTGTTYHFTIEDSPEIIPLKMLPSNLTGTAQIYVTVTDASGISSTTSFALIVDGQPEFYQFTGRVPDTGQTKCYDNNNEIPCPNSGEDFYGQDANYNINPQSFTKLDALGNDLPDSATEWVMVRDNISGLIWEVKTDDGSIHDKDNTYTWYDSNPETNGGNPGKNGDGTDTEDFINGLNDSNFGGFLIGGCQL